MGSLTPEGWIHFSSAEGGVGGGVAEPTLNLSLRGDLLYSDVFSHKFTVTMVDN